MSPSALAVGRTLETTCNPRTFAFNPFGSKTVGERQVRDAALSLPKLRQVAGCRGGPAGRPAPPRFDFRILRIGRYQNRHRLAHFRASSAKSGLTAREKREGPGSIESPALPVFSRRQDKWNRVPYFKKRFVYASSSLTELGFSPNAVRTISLVRFIFSSVM